MKIAVVIPAYNEEKNIATVVQGLKPVFEWVVVIDDGSSDKTSEAASISGATTLRHLINRGQGAALRTGTSFALKEGADIIVHFDADGQFLTEDIKTVVEPLLKGEADIVFGSRFLGKKSNLPWTKEYIIMPLARLVNLTLADVRLKDPQSGFRALSGRAAVSINFQHDGSAHCSEIMYTAHKQQLRIKEVPITVLYKDFGQGLFGGKGRGVGGLKILKDLIISKIVD